MPNNKKRSDFSALYARRLSILVGVVAVLVCALSAERAVAGEGTWNGLSGDIFGSRTIHNGQGIVKLGAPTRPEDQRAVPVSIDAQFNDGRTVKSVTLVVDENPMPVAEVFTMGANQRSVSLKTKVRLNQQTDVRAIVEASDGELYMASRLVKFAGGQAACAAPPTGNPEEIAANMGKMSLERVAAEGNATSIVQPVRLKISHPNHTGMALDQQTLLYIPLRMITELEVRQGEVKLFDMKGSISISENPVFEFPVSLIGADALKVVLNDSEGTEWVRVLPIHAGS